uniref:Uncharacterized protein n=1 Tax=Glycine max TaxID=3847 RepID=A0A368UGY5_SOYBN
MHLWPTKNLRDSFKHSYLKRLEWNYQRMKAEKDQQSSTEQKLLENENQDQSNNGDAPTSLIAKLALCFSFSLNMLSSID